MRYNITHLHILTLALLSLASCSSTEVLPSNQEERNTQVSITVSAPGTYAFDATRADDSHQIRIIAHLYPLDANGSAVNSATPLSTQEVLYRDADTKLTFNIENTGRYCVTVFADYIPVSATPSGNHYPDTYYDTTNPAIIAVKTKGETIEDFFNNESRECFVGKTVFTKGLNACQEQLTLTRAVSRISISAPSDPVKELIKSVQVTKCSHLATYNFALDDSDLTGTAGSKATDPLDGCSPVTLFPVEKRLFYFYTFGSQTGASSSPQLGEISFRLTPNDKIELENMEPRTIPSGKITPVVNYQISVNGGAGWISAKPGGDDINVNIQPLPSWNDKPGTIL